MEMDVYDDQFSDNVGYLRELEKEKFQFDPEESEDGNEKNRPDDHDNDSSTSRHPSYSPCSSVGAYFREMSRVPFLSQEQECDLAKKIEEGEKRIKTLLLQSPVGREWITRVAGQMERGEIRAKDILEAAQNLIRREKDDERTLRNRFLSLSREVLDLCAENDYLREGVDDTREQGSTTLVKMTRNEMVIEDLFDQIPIKRDILKDLESSLRERIDLMERVGGGISCSAPFRQRLVNILSAVQKFKREVKQARDDFVKANLRLVINIAKKYVNWGLSLSDLIQEGNIGLIKAVDRFDYRKRHRFASYASWWILQGISRAVPDQGRTIRVPIHAIKDDARMVKAFCSLLNQLGRKPTPLEVAEVADMPLEKVNKIFQVPMTQPISLQAPAGDNGRQFGDLIADEDALSPLEVTIRINLAREIRKALASLTPREAQILRMRFGIDEKKDYTLAEMGQEFGITREGIRQIENRALGKLKHRKRRRKLESFYE